MDHYPQDIGFLININTLKSTLLNPGLQRRPHHGPTLPHALTLMRHAHRFQAHVLEHELIKGRILQPKMNIAPAHLEELFL